MYRYWTGTAWTTAVTPNPAGTQAPQTSATTPASRRQGAWGWWLGGLAALLVIGVGIWYVAQSFGGGTLIPGSSPSQPGSNPTQLICPPGDDSAEPPETGNQDGWITAGKLAYPALGDPWDVGLDNRVPFGSIANPIAAIWSPAREPARLTGTSPSAVCHTPSSVNP